MFPDQPTPDIIRSDLIPKWALSSVQTGRQIGTESLARLSNSYNQLFVLAFYRYLEVTEQGVATQTLTQRRDAALAAIEICAELDAEWVRMQRTAISRHGGE
jgi:hypothetical protein